PLDARAARARHARVARMVRAAARLRGERPVSRIREHGRPARLACDARLRERPRAARALTASQGKIMTSKTEKKKRHVVVGNQSYGLYYGETDASDAEINETKSVRLEN